MAGEPENQRITRLTPLDDVLASIKASVAPVAPRAVDLSGALYRALAEDVAAAAGQPAEARALLDGYAVRAEDIADAGPYAPMPLAVAPVRVDVGEALPPGTDAVVPLDAIVEPRRALRGGCAGRRRRRRAPERRRSSMPAISSPAPDGGSMISISRCWPWPAANRCWCASPASAW